MKLVPEWRGQKFLSYALYFGAAKISRAVYSISHALKVACLDSNPNAGHHLLGTRQSPAKQSAKGGPEYLKTNIHSHDFAKCPTRVPTGGNGGHFLKLVVVKNCFLDAGVSSLV